QCVLRLLLSGVMVIAPFTFESSKRQRGYTGERGRKALESSFRRRRAISTGTSATHALCRLGVVAYNLQLAWVKGNSGACRVAKSMSTCAATSRSRQCCLPRWLTSVPSPATRLLEFLRPQPGSAIATSALAGGRPGTIPSLCRGETAAQRRRLSAGRALR